MLKLGTIFVFNVSNGSNKACLIRTVRVFFFVGVQNEGPTHLKGIVDERLQREVSMFKYKTYLGMILESSEFSNEYNICIYKEDWTYDESLSYLSPRKANEPSRSCDKESTLHYKYLLDCSIVVRNIARSFHIDLDGTFWNNENIYSGHF